MSRSVRPAVARPVVLALAGLAFLGVGPQPARAGSGGPDASGYTWTDSADGCSPGDEAWGAGVVEHLDVQLADVVGPVDLGFAMPFHGEAVTQAWISPCGFLPGEHHHLKKAVNAPTAAFQLASAEDDRSRALTEIDECSPLQFFDLHVANVCKLKSADEYPPDNGTP